ncbi:MAG: ATP-binding protein [Granulosicoccus sp.]
MGIELTWLFVIAISYLGLLFLIAWSADSGLLPSRLINHPLVYSLSLGVYATSWTYYGSVGLADSSGYAFLTIYLGVTLAFLLGPYLLSPILRLCRVHQLNSIADLLAFRYGGRVTGFVVTLFMLVGILPYISLQIRAVTESVQILSQQVPPNLLALGFCVAITIFAILFGARHLSPREKHHGLVVAIAFESAVKLIALLVAGVFVITQVFDSPAALNDWANSQPEMLESLYAPSRTNLWSTLLLLAFCAAFLLPRQYHMTFVENENPKHLTTAYWLFPLYLLLLNLPIIPILFAGRHLSLAIEPDFYVLGMTLTAGHQWLAILVFLGGLSAASAMMIVTTLALSYMCLNHLLLPASLSSGKPDDFYRRLLWSKRLIIALIIAAGYGFYIVIELNEGLASLGLISFVAAAQLLPGVIGLLFWTRATQTGFVSGLAGGAIVWFLLLIWPLLSPSTSSYTEVLAALPEFSDIWSLATFCTLSVNGTLFIVGSLFTTPSRDEINAAEAATESTSIAMAGSDVARSAIHYRYAMQKVLGNKVAAQELNRALAETHTNVEETRPADLQLLHDQLERNLTGLVGPALAREVLRHKRPDSKQLESPDARLLELHIEASRQQMRGMTRQLDDLRRYLRDVLRQLPLGVCSISADGRVYLWNAAMHELTGIEERVARDQPLDQLPEPWSQLLQEFAASGDAHLFRCHVPGNTRLASVNLHKADIATPAGSDETLGGQVVLMEDRSSLDTLEAELAHSERLASVGRLAAGVAHEIGNPLTGIASIAQNLLHDAANIEDNSVEIGDQADDILAQVNRINGIVRSLLSFSHADTVGSSSHEPVCVNDCVQESLGLIRLSPEVRHIHFSVDVQSTAMVKGDANQLIQVFVNLIGNACDASPDGATVCIESLIQDKQLIVTISDSGPGVDSTTREKMFEPFFTTKPVGMGTGLGLSLVYSIITNHNGKIRVDSPPGGGTCMIVSLPLLTA